MLTTETYTADEAKQFVPEGWYSLVDRLYMALPYFQEHYDSTVDKAVRQQTPYLIITSVGELAGKFHATFNFPFPELMSFAQELSDESISLCKFCGTTPTEGCRNDKTSKLCSINLNKK